MKKTILLSLVVTSLVMGANTVDGLTIDQKNEITSSSTIDNSTVHQGKTEVLGASDVDDVVIQQKNTPSISGNHIENSNIVDSDVHQGYTRIKNSIVEDLKLDSKNQLINIGKIDNSTLQQGVFMISDSNATDSESTDIDISSLNIIKGSNVNGSSTDVNATTINQTVTLIENGAKVDALSLKYDNLIEDSDIDNTNISQGTLTVNKSELTTVYVRKDDESHDNPNQILDSSIDGGVILQSNIDISNNSIVDTLESYSTNTIQHFDSTDSTDSNITQNSIVINNAHVTNLKTTQINFIGDTTAQGSWAKKSTITQGMINIH